MGRDLPRDLRILFGALAVGDVDRHDHRTLPCLLALSLIALGVERRGGQRWLLGAIRYRPPDLKADRGAWRPVSKCCADRDHGASIATGRMAAWSA
jgi:hypothetical protein